MYKILHILLIIFFFSCNYFSIIAQENRINNFKKTNTENNIKTKSNTEVLGINKAEIQENLKGINTNNTTTQLRINDSLSIQKIQTEKGINNLEISIQNNTAATENASYTKVTFSENEKTTNTERSYTKIKPSINYVPKQVKADIHPIVDYNSAPVNPNKKDYLLQEANDLQREIELNTNNPNYELEKNTRKLEEIRDLIEKTNK
ncbi:MAG TPA: hypothetical protein PKK18_02885 [Chitinophagales bacterium]|nr:hypothetical protein [Chitinophagales bacterium]HMY23406.1 hypothetical protein [Chitinophagales bacterium]HMZ33787.1 hypothetical protein [Chitinophagales bacterium]HNA39427.1 hypothetical protein [Chitinophagales bacterium]HNB48764.1 hypothetical protein [Chitinophagales bacterium]